MDVQIEFDMWSSGKDTKRNYEMHVTKEQYFWFGDFLFLYIMLYINIFVSRVTQRRLTSSSSLQFLHDIERDEYLTTRLLNGRTHYPFACKLILRDRYELIPYDHVNSILTRHKYIYIYIYFWLLQRTSYSVVCRRFFVNLIEYEQNQTQKKHIELSYWILYRKLTTRYLSVPNHIDIEVTSLQSTSKNMFMIPQKIFNQYKHSFFIEQSYLGLHMDELFISQFSLLFPFL